MEIKDIISLITKRWILIVTLSVAAILCAAVVSFYFLKDVYEASAVMIISSPRNNQDQGQLSLNDYTLNTKLVNSYRVLCKTDKILNQVISETKLPLTVKELSDKIDVTAQSDTEIINITVQDTNPKTAAQIANAVAKALKEKIPDIMQMNNVQIIDDATVPLLPVKPDRKMILAVAALLGLLVGVGIAFLIDYFDVSIKTSDQLVNLMEAPLLGIIPQMQERTK
jgi:capsular polysaccharide biosynthesis protein